MNKQERATLREIANNLRSVTKTPWSEGNLEKWAAWAEKMKFTILSSANLIEVLYNSSDEDVDNNKPLTLD